MALPTAQESFTFGGFEVRLGSRELCRDGVRVRLADQSFQVLAMLLARRGELLTREEIRQQLWAEGTFVDFDHGLNNAVNRLREALGDSAESPRFIETLPRRGYRFIARLDQDVSPPIQIPPDCSASVTSTENIKQWKWVVVVAGSGILLLALLAISAMRGRRASANPIASLAVLPLENVSGDPAQEYFADGITDTLITDLAELGSVRVISRTSAMHYKGTHKSLPEIARDLNVDAVVEGTVSKAGDRVRINAQLIDARNEGHIWAKAYERDMRDVLRLQNEVASAISMEVSGRLTPNRASRLAAISRQVNPQAYESYLKGQYFLEKWTEEGFAKAKNHFEQSIAVDPTYADAYAGLGEYYAMVAFMGMAPPQQSWLKAEDLLVKASEMDDNSSKVHSLLGMIKMQFHCDPAAAEKELDKAITLNPGDMRALDYHSYYFLETGHIDEAIAEKKRILERDPLRVITNAELGQYLLYAGRTDEAIAQLQKTLELDPNYAAAYMRLGLAYAQKQQYSQAVVQFQRAIALDDKPMRFIRLGDLYARWGKRQEAQETIRHLQKMGERRYVSPTGYALIYARLDDRRAAIAELEKAKPEDEPKITDPGFENLKSDPRFMLLEARLKPAPSCPAF